MSVGLEVGAWLRLCEGVWVLGVGGENNSARSARNQEAQCPGLMGCGSHGLANWLRRSDTRPPFRGRNEREKQRHTFA